ncbi:hypothetical protein QTN24_12135 [Cupriavidus sp. SZY C1]|uniref:hypothetical protein n=1 Tax=Cupriavidus sp. SZY C1 TaxID=3055037 RepID=UPI0028B63622|nr:hypothetical protein [Cupriavidus sp. SZY C1]MDT6962247.1 hypothetical protein [Cupriavidus sp. SZY C1]
MHIFETNAAKVNQLDDAQLTSLLNRLLILEAEAACIPVNSIEVGLNIRAGDGGVDASIRWTEGVEATSFLPSRFQVFQCKAEKMSPAKCASELVAEDGALKPLVAQAIAEAATYILFTTEMVNAKMKLKRVEAMREKLTELGNPHAASAQFVVYSAEDIARWANSYLPAVAYVQAVTGFSIVPGLKSWTEWNASDAGQWPFHQTSTASKLLDEIRRTLSEPRRSIRLNGLPGLGKTRLVLEALGPSETNPGLAPRTVYYNAAHASTGLPNQVIEWVRHGLSGVLVVDNCLPEVHTQLEREVLASTSKLSLISIFANPSEDLSVAARLILQPCAPTELADASRQYINGLPDSDASKIAHLAGGFIFFAYLLCDAYTNGQGIDGILVDSEALFRFLGRAAGAPDDDALRTIEACSIFESLEFADGNGPEAASVIGISEVNPHRFYRHVRSFVRRGVIEATGRFIRVRPHPLALRLCRNWWEGVAPQRALQIFESIPESMVDSLCERLRMLDTLPEARNVTAQLCEEAAPFGQAEVLFSVRGARIFRALAEVNPESACKSLGLIIEDTDIETLRGARNSRRDWVWALSKLIFRANTYSGATDALVKLSLAENEQYSNNATGTLLQTFQVHLPGTEVSLEKRVDRLAALLSSSEATAVALGLKAVDIALRSEYFTRTSGAEEQGSGPVLRDYEPESFEEVIGYWRQVLEHLKEAVEAGRCRADDVLPLLAGHMRGFIRVHADELATLVVDYAISWHKRPWEDGIDSLRDATRYDIGADETRAAAIEALIEKLSPSVDDIAGQLALYVSRPGWSVVAHEPSDGSTGPLSSKLIELAQHCAADFDKWAPYVRTLFTGEQRAGFEFGKQLASSMLHPDAFLHVALEVLRNSKDAVVDLNVMCGFASIAHLRDSAWTGQLVAALFSETQLHQFAVEILSYVSPDIETLRKLIVLAKQDLIGALSLQRLAYGQALRHLSASEISELVLEIASLSDDAAWVALEIGYMSYFGRTEEMWPELRATIRAIHVSGRLLLPRGGRSRYMHSWEETVLKLLDDVDDSFALSIAQQLVTAASQGSSSTELPDKVAKKLLRSHSAVVWPVFAGALMGNHRLLTYRLSSFLGRGLRGNATETDFPLAHLPEDVLENWFQQSSGAPALAARMLRVIEVKDESIAWTRLGRLLIDEFGGDPDVLSSITANLRSGVFAGPRTAFWQDIISILTELSDHQLKQVREWAKRLAKALSADIAAEQHESDARSVGRW